MVRDLRGKWSDVVIWWYGADGARRMMMIAGLSPRNARTSAGASIRMTVPQLQLETICFLNVPSIAADRKPLLVLLPSWT